MGYFYLLFLPISYLIGLKKKISTRLGRKKKQKGSGINFILKIKNCDNLNLKTWNQLKYKNKSILFYGIIINIFIF